METTWTEQLAIPTVEQLRKALWLGSINMKEFNLLAVRCGLFGVQHTLDEVAHVYNVNRADVRRWEVRALIRCQQYIGR